MLAVLLALGGGGTGCSYLFAKGPPDHYVPSWQLDCSSQYVAPALDTLMTMGGVYRVATSLPRSEASYSPGGLTHTQDVVAAFGTLLLYGSSAIFGYNRVSACREAMGPELDREEAAARARDHREFRNLNPKAAMRVAAPGNAASPAAAPAPPGSSPSAAAAPGRTSVRQLTDSE